MSKEKKIFVRLGVSDLVLSKEEAETVPGYISVTDNQGEYVTDVETYIVGYEDEDGNECDENGNRL
jgi:hypothetical protein